MSIATAGNELRSWLRAGEAASAMLLTATTLGRAGCPLTEPLEVPQVRERIRHGLLDGFGHPQLVIRMGWAATSAASVPVGPRLPPAEVLRPLEPLPALA